MAPDIFHNYTFLEFEHRDLLELYLEHPDYAIDP